ncbi:uroporphyrinogen-III C-methyltransferase [Lachnoclostridium phytofermentans]|uniref:uroporphyrinogen-III C-methyltransferase n=1 Tax=Lachnoclostridium phytofermentans (strain ATCC 700394 / DSM 18823 / ISDg) TaxID=357809 RepID=A9KP84_LACP7|nr:uroporphyrinogen-III C-methyltransferase [Lachnoclostridium phytofermentans]ABX41746.1 uroporphyrin-III C-methyltransferase [Lachnoclostridium phytofermentans ISDg]
MKKGKVWLVGAGPAETDLLTIKAKKAIEQADVVVYDRLVGQGILMMIPEDVKCIDVGKCAGNHTMPQKQINQILLQEAMSGKQVVRLKGGDPFLFGRGGEELELLSEYDIPFEIVPGITSAISVPAYHGIPVTHRDYCSSVHIITGHRGKDKPYDIDFDALVRTKGTLVFLMGASALGDICDGLMRAGIETDMPAAILQKGTTSKQKQIVATIGTLEQEVKRQGVETPAIIVVGKVCQLANDFSWYEKRPLSGKKIVVTRPKELVSTLSEKLKSKGAEVLEIPTIRIAPLKNNIVLKNTLLQLDQFQWLVFTSPSGVDVFFNAMKEEKIDIRKLANLKVAVVGEGTKKKVEDRGILVDLIPENYYGKSLGKSIRMSCCDGDRILIPRASIGNEEIMEEIKKNPLLEVMDIPIYDTVYSTPDIINLKDEFERGNIDFAVFTSKSTVTGFVKATKDLDYHLVNAVCIGEQTRDEAQKNNMKTWMSKKATIDSLVETIEELASVI